MEQPGVVMGNFALSFSLNFLSIFVHIKSPIGPNTLIWASLERSFPPAEVEYRWCQFWSKVMTSEEEERPRFIKGSYGRHRCQWVKLVKKKCLWILVIACPMGKLENCFSGQLSKNNVIS